MLVGSQSKHICLKCQQLLVLTCSSKQRLLPLWQKASYSSESSIQVQSDQHDYDSFHPVSRSRTGRSLTEDWKSLDTFVLGKPAEIFVLRENSSRRHARPKSADSEEEVPRPNDGQLNAEQLFESAYAERGLLADCEVNENLDRLKPSRDALPLNQFERLRDELVDGFTKWQLRRYIESAVGNLPRKPEAPKTMAELSRAQVAIKPRSWAPGTTPFGQRLDIGKEQRKDKLAEYIIRRIWNVQEFGQEKIGELELDVSHEALSLLLLENGEVFSTLAESKAIKIDVSRQRQEIRFTGCKGNAEAAAEELCGIATDRRSLKIDLSKVYELSNAHVQYADRAGKRTHNSPLKRDEMQRLLASIAAATGTAISETGNSKLEIRHLGYRESAAQDAKRLILSCMLKPPQSFSTLLDVCGVPRFGVTHCDVGGLDLVNEQKSWARLVADRSGGEIDTTSGGIALKIAEGHQRHVEAVIAKLRKDTLRKEAAHSRSFEKLSDPPQWSPRPVSTTSISFGHVLHEASRKESRRNKPRLTWHPRQFLDQQIFAYTAPNILGILEREKGKGLTRAEESIMIRLIPSPWTLLDLGLVHSAPLIQVEVNFEQSTGRPYLKRVFAVLREYVSNISQPHRLCDLRYSDQSILPLDCPGEEITLQNFLGQSSLDINGPGRLRVPNQIQLRLPRRAFIFNHSAETSTDWNDVKKEHITLDYQFTALEYQRALSFEINNCEAQYTVIEAGKTGGGRRSELRMKMNSADPTARNAHSGTLSTNFVSSALEFVASLGNE